MIMSRWEIAVSARRVDKDDKRHKPFDEVSKIFDTQFEMDQVFEIIEGLLK